MRDVPWVLFTLDTGRGGYSFQIYRVGVGNLYLLQSTCRSGGAVEFIVTRRTGRKKCTSLQSNIDHHHTYAYRLPVPLLVSGPFAENFHVRLLFYSCIGKMDWMDSFRFICAESFHCWYFFQCYLNLDGNVVTNNMFLVVSILLKIYIRLF